MLKQLLQLCLTLLLTSSCFDACAAIVSTAGSVNVIPAPRSVQQNQLVSDVKAFCFLERNEVELTSDLAVDAISPGLHQLPSDLPLSVLRSGLRVASYFFHSDLPTDSTYESVLFAASVSFDVDILGVIFSSGLLQVSDSVLGSPSTNYGDEGYRGFEEGPVCGIDLTDCVAISPDRRSVTFFLNTGTAYDQFRVVTAIPEPASLGLLGLGLVGLALTRSRKR